MIQAFDTERFHLCTSPESCGVVRQRIQWRVKGFFSFCTCSMSDVKGYFGKIGEERLYRHTDTSINEPIIGIGSNKLTFKIKICKKCNNERTQPYDRAWEVLSKYLQTHWQIIVKNGYFSLLNVFPKDTRKNALHVHLYFVKLLGCKLLEEKVPINIGRFSEALLSEMSHKDVLLTFANSPEIPTCDDQLIFSSRIEFGNYDSCLPDIGLWTYMLHPVSIRIAYLSSSSPHEFRSNAWHPNQASNKVNLGIYHPQISV